MLKYVFLAGAMTLAVPAFAQNMPVQPAAPQTTQPAPTTTDQAAPAPATPTESAPAAQTADAAPVQDSTGPAAQPAATGTQVASVVDQEFASYDKDGNGTLSASEFGAWMVALKTASDPATKPASKETKTWVGQAFAQADTDKSKSVSKTELTGFLSAQG